MKKISAAALSLFFLSSPLFAADVPAVSRVSKVTVYPDRALVTREAQVQLEKGDNTIVFEGLPGSLLEESLRARGSGVPVTLHGAELKKVFTAGEADARVAALQAELEKLRDERRALDLRREALQGQRRFLDSVRDFSSVQVPKEIQTKSSTAAEWTGIAQYLVDAYGENLSKDLEIDSLVRQKDREVEAKQNELNELYGGSNEKKTVFVSVEAREKGAFTAELSYLVPQASWTISYDAKVDPAKKECSLVSYANVRQWSGEEWKDVSLGLSSARPAVGGRMPELAPWFVDIRQPVVYAEAPALARKSARLGSFAGAAREEMEMGVAEAPGAAAPVEAESSQAAVSQELSSVSYDLTRAVTVPADNRLEKFPVKTETMAVELDYETTPKLSPYAFLHTRVANDKDYALMAGEVNVFAGDAYIGKSSLPTVGRGEKFDLYLGVDEEIRVKRTELADRRKKTLLGLRARKDFAYKIEVENYKKEPVRVTVIDQLPVSKNADVKTELVSANPKPTETRDLGISRWTLELPAAGKTAVEFSFYVEFPADKPVSGI
ncbi:MAG TPA: mucoidy inhibitor MuiA family protein [Candidatus Eisenbacteria bacterium]|nr:mucoidy inhibitor MuiA family protein [Candidatus Eisenbacteria bacterium]